MRLGLVAAAALVVLSGCGGGGGGPTASSSSFPVREALSRFLTNGGTLTATFGAWTATQTITPGQPQGSRATAASSVTVRKDGAYVGGDGVTYILSGDDSVLYGYEKSHHRAVYTIDAPLPVEAKVGDGGPFLSYTGTSTSGGNAVVSGSAAWTLNADSATTAMMCLKFDQTDLITKRTTTETDCYRIDEAGNVSGATFTIPVNGEVWTFR